MAKKQSATDTPAMGTMMLNLDPATILCDDNSRFGLKSERIDTLGKSILSMGGIMEPVEVEPLTESENGFKYRLTSGFYRVAAALKLNGEQGAGLTVPAIVHTPEDAKARLIRQLTENIERESQSPMDQAIAVKKLFDAGYSRIEIREMFKRPGGRKGTKVQPASNSWLNMMMSFLTLPKGTQEKVHDGRVGVSAAYEMTKVPKEKQEAILASAEVDRVSAFEKEEREEKRIVEAQAKVEDAEKKSFEALSALEGAKQVEATAKTALDTSKEILNAAFKTKHEASKDKKKEADKAFKAAEVDRADAEVALEKATKERETIEKKQTAAAKFAAEKADKLRQIREGRKAGAAKPGAAVSGKDVKAAIAKDNSQPVPLSMKSAREAVEELTTAVNGNKKVRAIGTALLACFNGVTTPEALYRELEAIVK